MIPPDTAVVFATGSWTPLLMAKLLGVYCPVYPLKGYDLMMDMGTTDLPKQMIAVDRTYFTPLNTQFRVCGVGHFAGFSTEPSPKVENMLRSAAREVLVNLPILNGAVDHSKVYCGLRPLSSDGAIIFGKIDSFSNVYCNVGPGQNGWKIGYGVGKILAAVIDGEQHKYPSLSPDGRIKKSPLFSKIVCWRHGQ